jgi:hypothetical protein
MTFNRLRMSDIQQYLLIWQDWEDGACHLRSSNSARLYIFFQQSFQSIDSQFQSVKNRQKLGIIQIAGFSAFNEHQTHIIWVRTIYASADGQDFGVEVQQLVEESLTHLQTA